MREDIIKSIKSYIRAANYLSAIQIYLCDNFFLEQKLIFNDIKPRLLGHWGTCPGINFIYAHLNAFIKKHNVSTLFVLGPGHGFPALQANLFLEGTLKHYYPQASHDRDGIAYLAKKFSWPYGFPSHTNPGTPGAILEGGELGYALSTAYGAVLDNPELLVPCIIGDGEAETGPTATAWHLSKLIDPATNGTVLPILHLNGYKISAPTIFGRMSNDELVSLFYGYGYEPIIVEGDTVYKEMFSALERCYQIVLDIKEDAKNGGEGPYRFPMIILKTLKGWTGIKELHNEKIEGNCLSHQVVVRNAKTDKQELDALEKWLRSYQFEDLFNENGFVNDIRSIIPSPDLCMGNNEHAFGNKKYKKLALPQVNQFAEDIRLPGDKNASCMRKAGDYLREVFVLNEKNKNFRFMSPDETYSNKLDAIFEATSRAFILPTEKWDKDLSAAGRVMEMLSEHSLQGLAQGYILTGRHALFASYESFISIVSSMAEQYAKFLNASHDFSWRGGVSSLNYILTSSGWRQEHNGFSHQNPGFIDSMLQRQGCFIRAYFPSDANSTLAVLQHCLESKDGINIIVAGKTFEPCWLSIENAKNELERGLMIWDFASDPDPDIVFSAVGDYLTKESLAAIDLLKQLCPLVRVRFVNILELSAIGIGSRGCTLPFYDFDDFFTCDKPVIFNYHGYPETMKSLLFNKENSERFIIRGYIESGSTTTPFDMQVRNKTSRYHLVMEALLLLKNRNVISSGVANTSIKKCDEKLQEHREYIEKFGIDMEEITNWKWKKSNTSV